MRAGSALSPVAALPVVQVLRTGARTRTGRACYGFGRPVGRRDPEQRGDGVPRQTVFKPLSSKAELAVRIVGCGLILAAVWLTWSLAHRELDFDEADYLNIAR